MTLPHLSIPARLIDETIAALQTAGRRRSECIVLWLGHRQSADQIDITEAFVPVQEASSHRFRIPAQSMRQLMARLRETGTFVAAQVHSHPEKAFHSETDDEMAIISHAGACSLVLPYFALTTTRQTFVAQTELFCLSDEDRWTAVPHAERDAIVEIV